MCGIVGIFNLDGAPVNTDRLLQATNVQRHRGPDDEGYLLINSRDGTVVSCRGSETNSRLDLPHVEQFRGRSFDQAFGFRRLSILDLSPTGHQPMNSADGRLWIVFNGEIYNYQELRAELIGYGHQFHGTSDTEVIIAAYQQWGVSCLTRFNGMFVFVIWDSRAKNIFVARDRFGEKPFHYVYVPGKLFAFASEIKALWAAGVVERRIDQETRARFKYYGQVDEGEQTFYENVFRLPQAHWLSLDGDGNLQKRRYWDIDPRLQEEGHPDAWYSEKFRQLLSESVRIRLRSDVPVGSNLSGGLDSSTLVSLMNTLLPQNTVQKTFSVRFDDPIWDEGRWIDQITTAIRIEPHFVWPTAEEFFDELSILSWHHDEPFTSTSVYAQWCAMRLAKERGVTVLLDGQGADESLAGYHSYFATVSDDLLKSLNLSEYLRWRKMCQNLYGDFPYGEFSGSLERVIRQSMPVVFKRPLKKLLRLANHPEVEPIVPSYPYEFRKVSGLRKILWWETTRHGLVELLRYADRNSMAHSREVRLPFLDHHLVEFVFKLPNRFLIRDGWTKWILREAFKEMLPRSISFRVDKLGFMPPPLWLGKRTWEDLMLEQFEHDAAPSPAPESLPATIMVESI